MASRALLIALVAMLLVASAAAQATPAHSKSKNKCARFANCARCGPAPAPPTSTARSSRRRPQVCLECGPNTDPVELENGGFECPCGTNGDGFQTCDFSARAWTAYAIGEDLCTVKRNKRGRVVKRTCPPRPNGCVACGEGSLSGCFIAESGACAYSNGDLTVTAGRRLFGVDEEMWA
jgi:hypothetical protein